MISVACYQDKYRLNPRLIDQLLQTSLGKECPVAFWHHLGQLTIPSNVLVLKRLEYFCTLSLLRIKLTNSDWLLWLRFLIFDVFLGEKSLIDKSSDLGGYSKEPGCFIDLPEHSRLR